MSDITYMDDVRLLPFSTAGVGNMDNQINLTVQPNPLRNAAQISLENVSLPCRIALYDMTGRLVRGQSEVSDKSFMIERGGLPVGIYMLRLWDRDGRQAAEKLMIE